MKVRLGKEHVKQMMKSDESAMKRGKDINPKLKSLSLLISMVSLKDNAMSNNRERNEILMLLFCAQNAERYVGEFTDQFPKDLKIGDLNFSYKFGKCFLELPMSSSYRIRNVFEIYENISIWTSNLWQRFDIMKHIRLTDTI
jgi:hypothetical protein